MIATPAATEKTQARILAEAYLRLGGRRLAKVDDNITSIRQWEEEPLEAARFWEERIATLSEADRKDVEFFLPDINKQ